MYFSIEFLILSAVCVLIIFGTIINHYKQSSSMWFKKYNELYEKYEKEKRGNHEQAHQNS